jgi:hypothetical protein
MTSIYTDTPLNFSEIEAFVTTDIEAIEEAFIIAEKCYFYDSCSIRRHSQLPCPEVVFDFMKKMKGIVVITRGILMELASHSGILHNTYVQYIKKMQQAGLQVIILYEESVFDILAQCFSQNAIINRYLSFAVKVVKRPTSTIERTLKNSKTLLNDVIKNQKVQDSTVFMRFFEEVRKNKVEQDNLGEELLAICVHLLSNIPDYQAFKYIILTDDKGAIQIINKTSKNVYENNGRYSISVLSTTRLAQRLCDEQILTDKEQIEEFLSIGTNGDNIRLLGSEEYDLEPKEKVMCCSVLAEKILTPNAIHINY